MNSSFKALPDSTASHALSNTAVTLWYARIELLSFNNYPDFLCN